MDNFLTEKFFNDFNAQEVKLNILVNVTANSGERDRGSVLRDLILCRLFFRRFFPFLNFKFQKLGPCQAAGGPSLNESTFFGLSFNLGFYRTILFTQ